MAMHRMFGLTSFFMILLSSGCVTQTQPSVRSQVIRKSGYRVAAAPAPSPAPAPAAPLPAPSVNVEAPVSNFLSSPLVAPPELGVSAADRVERSTPKVRNEAQLIFGQFHDLVTGKLDPIKDANQLGSLKVFAGIKK